MQTNHTADNSNTSTRTAQSCDALSLLVTLPDDALLTDAEAAMVLIKSQATLARWRANGTGPKVTRIGSRGIAYKMGVLREYLAR